MKKDQMLFSNESKSTTIATIIEVQEGADFYMGDCYVLNPYNNDSRIILASGSVLNGLLITPIANLSTKQKKAIGIPPAKRKWYQFWKQ